MKRHLLLLSVAMFAVIPVEPAIAVNLINEDRVSYDVVVHDPTGARMHVLGPAAVLPDVCYRCDITVDGVGRISAEPGDTIKIRNRSFQVGS